MMKKNIGISVFLLLSLSCTTTYDMINEPVDLKSQPIFEEEETENLAWLASDIQISESYNEMQKISTDLQIYGENKLEELRKIPTPSDILGMVQTVNQDSLQYPQLSEVSANFTGGIYSYTFYEGLLYQVYTMPGKVTDIRLEEGEFLDSSPVIGDSTGWEVGNVTSNSATSSYQHILIKPFSDGLYTTLTLYTNKRVYYFELRSFSDTYMIGVRFKYPTNSFSVSQPGSITQSRLNPTEIHWSYGVKGDESLHFYPKSVYASKIKTYIVFEENILHSMLPVVWGSHKGKKELLNHRIKGNIMEIDAVPDTLLLQIDDDTITIQRM